MTMNSLPQEKTLPFAINTFTKAQNVVLVLLAVLSARHQGYKARRREPVFRNPRDERLEEARRQANYLMEIHF